MRVVFAGASQTNVRLYFVGKPDSIEFAGVLDDHSEYGGLYRIGYNVRSSPPALGLSYRIFRAINDTSLPQQMDILAGAAALHFQYYGDVDGEGTLKWSPNWIDRDTLPKLVSLTVDFKPGDKRHWPPLVIAVETAN
jgi:hypothetical protein